MDFYEILGVRSKATLSEIRRAYRHWARLLHPALNPGDVIAVSRYEAVTQAFEVLADPERRKAYDRGELSPSETSVAAHVGFEGFDFSIESAQQGVGFREIFGSVLSRSSSMEDAVSGEDLEFAVRVGLDEVFSGTNRRVHLIRQDRCLTCAGSGTVACPGFACTRCQGSGLVKARRGHMVFTRPCTECSGAGTITTRICSRCHGEGLLTQSEWLDVEIPKGVRDGSQVRIPNGGNAGRRGGASGDLVLTVEVEPHPFYRWEGDDLACNVPVTMVEASLGGYIDVPTPDGSVAIALPAGTQTGQRFRLRGRGTPRMEAKGRADLYVEIHVVVPTIVDDRSRALLHEVAERNPMNPRDKLRDAAVLTRAADSEARRGRGGQV